MTAFRVGVELYNLGKMGTIHTSCFPYETIYMGLDTWGSTRHDLVMPHLQLSHGALVGGGVRGAADGKPVGSIIEPVRALNGYSPWPVKLRFPPRSGAMAGEGIEGCKIRNCCCSRLCASFLQVRIPFLLASLLTNYRGRSKQPEHASCWRWLVQEPEQSSVFQKLFEFLERIPLIWLACSSEYFCIPVQSTVRSE